MYWARRDALSRICSAALFQAPSYPLSSSSSISFFFNNLEEGGRGGKGERKGEGKGERGERENCLLFCWRGGGGEGRGWEL